MIQRSALAAIAVDAYVPAPAVWTEDKAADPVISTDSLLIWDEGTAGIISVDSTPAHFAVPMLGLENEVEAITTAAGYLLYHLLVDAAVPWTAGDVAEVAIQLYGYSRQLTTNVIKVETSSGGPSEVWLMALAEE